MHSISITIRTRVAAALVAGSASAVLLAGSASADLLAGSASAASVADPAGDFLASYTGPQNADLDILSLSAAHDGSGVHLAGLLNGNAGTTAGGALIWGVNRGSGFPGLIASGPPTVGPPTLLLDAIVALNYNGTGRVRTFAGGSFVDTFLAAGTVTISGSSIGAYIPFNLLPTTGFATADYTYVGWTRSALGSQALIADLAPERLPFKAGVVPEPGVWALLIAGFGLVGHVARRRRAAVLS